MTGNVLSRTQIDRLGDRLKKALHTESDLRLLDEYRRSFGEAYNTVIRTVREQGKFPTGRPAKSTPSIAEKLRRESIRLSQMQDIAGCRVVVANVMEQEQVVDTLRSEFLGASVIDRRAKPSYGYRAVHVIAKICGKPVEIQVRTALQHLWAELSEKFSDALGLEVKYGGGIDEIRVTLARQSELVADLESIEQNLFRPLRPVRGLTLDEEYQAREAAEVILGSLPASEGDKIRSLLDSPISQLERLKLYDQLFRSALKELQDAIADNLHSAILRIDEIGKLKDDLPY